MNVSRLVITLFVVFIMTACSSKPQFQNQEPSESTTMGRIAFPVLGERYMGKRSNTSIGVEVVLKNQKTGQVHRSLINFKEGKWVEYLDNLAPGVYVIDEYYEVIMGGFLPRRLKPSVEIMVGSGQTVLSPVFVRMTAHIYPHSGLGYIEDDKYWELLMVSRIREDD